jgi:serine phosphatase RsbU (regulator of sigma subunit)/anti-sigma regulatory factor (Ser/Thr protein kinase)/ABC-type transporter Mla MlaB component
MSAETGRNGDREAAADAFAQLDQILLVSEGPEQRVVALNDATVALFGGFDPIGRSVLEILGGMDVQGFAGYYDDAYRHGRVTTRSAFRLHWMVPDGTRQEIFLDFTVRPWRDAAGRLRGAIGSGIDVTESVLRRRAQQAQAAELAERYHRATDVIAELQQALLPAVVPVLPGLQVAARYLLAADEAAAGGDWFEVVPGGDGTVTLVVGDVVGHGVAATAVMAQLRAVLLDRLRSGEPLAEALAALDRFAAGVPGAHAATLCAARLDPATGTIAYCTAGHPPPLVVGPGGEARFLPASGAGPLATGTGTAVADEALDPGDLVVLYSDGIVERPGQPAPAGMVELAYIAGEAVADRLFPIDSPALAVDRVCEQATERLTRDTGMADDVTVLAAQLVAVPEPFAHDLDAGPGASAALRKALRAWLADHGAAAGDDLEVLDHTVAELVDNVADHAYGPEAAERPLHAAATLGPDGVVTLTVADRGRWRPADPPSPERGLGLALLRQLAAAVDVQHGPDGTCVAVRQPLRRPAGLLTTEGPVRRHVADAAHLAVVADPDAPGTLRVRGPVESDSATRLRAEIERLSTGTARLRVDLDGATLLASAGVHALHRAVRSAGERGVDVELQATTGSLADHVLTIAGLPHAPPPADG